MRGKSYRGTDEDLLRHGLAPVFRRLIVTALDGASVTYGELKRYLEEHAGFATIFPTRVGFVVGALMERIQAVYPDAPLINVLVVSATDQTPGRGAGAFMADRFGKPHLARLGFKKRHPKAWKAAFDQAADEVYLANADQWRSLYHRLFGISFAGHELERERTLRQEGAEYDYGSGSAKYGSGGEGACHKALRLWAFNNPGLIDRRFKDARTETEFPLDSGDRVDAVYHLKDRVVVVEVKSRISNAIDLRRGVFQCIKYRAVKAAMDLREEVPVEAVLVTEAPISGELRKLLRLHDIRHFEADPDRGLRPQGRGRNRV